MIHWELCKQLKFYHTNKWYVQNPISVLDNDTHKLLWDFEIQTDYLISARRLDLIINKKERTCRIMDVAIPADHRLKLKESEKRDQYLDLVMELKKLWNMKVTVIPIVTGPLGIVTKGLVQGMEDLRITGRIETVHTTESLRSARILRSVQET